MKVWVKLISPAQYIFLVMCRNGSCFETKRATLSPNAVGKGEYTLIYGQHQGFIPNSCNAFCKISDAFMGNSLD